VGHDLALYVAAGSEVELRAAVGGKFDDVLIDEACAFGRIASGGTTFEDLAKLACEVSRTGRDAMVLEMSTTSGGFHLDVFRGGRAVRELDYIVGDGWRVRRVRELAIAGGARVLALTYQAGRTELYVDLATLVRTR
jgi:hypothetical protein